MKGDKDDRGGQRELRTRVRPRPAERETGVFALENWEEELVVSAFVLQWVVHFQVRQQATRWFGIVAQRRHVAAGGYQPDALAIGPNCSIAGAAAFSSGQLYNFKNGRSRKINRKRA